MSQFKKSMLAFSVTAAMSGFGAVAQEAGEEADNTEVIQVTGIRGALQRAQAIKMDNTSIVEAISAEDIGKLPDTSVAESLARLPGLAGERRNGRTSGLSVRGFNENYVGTSLNGRELLGMGDNRGVEYDLYPSEIVSNIVVYKTPEAGLITQGIGGTVDLQTVEPLNADPTLTFNFNYEKNAEDAGNPDFDNTGHRLSLNFVDQFADDTLGVAIAIAEMESPRQENQFRAWGYDPGNDEAAQMWGTPPTAGEGVAITDERVLTGHDSFTRSALLERTSLAAIIEYAPNDKLNMQFDALYIDFEENDARRGVEEGGALWGGTPWVATGAESGFVTSGYYDGFYSVVRNDVRSQKSELTSFGLNVEYAIDDDWTATLDYAISEVDKELTDVESYSGVGRAGTDGRPPATARSWVMTANGPVYSNHPTIAPVDLTDPSIITLAGPQAWGAPIIGSDAQDGFVNAPFFDEELNSARFEVKGNVDWGIFSEFTAGINYSDRSKSKLNKGFYLTSPEYPGEGPIPDVLGVADLSFIGIPGVLAYDSLSLYNSGYYRATDADPVDAGRRGDTYKVNEELLTLYTKLTIDTEIGDIAVRGNFGLQFVDTKQDSEGFSTFADSTGNIAAVDVTGKASYNDVLPTLNLSFEVAEDQYIRTAFSTVQSRPRMDQMKPNNQANFSFNDNQINAGSPQAGPWSGNVGNPGLKPLEAEQFDLSYENYFADDAYFSVAFFYKDLTNWHSSAQSIVDFTPVYVEGYHAGSEGQAPATFLGVVDYTEDGRTGSVKGWEFQTSLPLSYVWEGLEGFGMFASATFIDGQLDPTDNLGEERVPGLSDETYSLTFYYENAGFEFRVSGTKRDAFGTETRGLSLSLQPTIGQGGKQVDAQIGYDFSESDIEMLHGLRVTLQGQNLTDEDEIQFANEDPRQVTLYQAYGANYMLGFNYEF